MPYTSTTLRATWLSPAPEIIFGRRPKKKLVIRPILFRTWKRKYHHILRILYVSYLHDHQFTLNEFRNKQIVDYDTYCQQLYGAKSLIRNKEKIIKGIVKGTVQDRFWHGVVE